MTHESMQGFASTDIWLAIQRISESPSPKKVASAYLGGSVDFKWNLGDVLLIGLSEKNVADGLIDLDKLEEIMEIGVKVFKRENLHAKIYFNSEMGVVCSCNLSEASQSKWLEAGIYTSNTQILESVASFFDLYAIENNLVKKEELQKLRLIKKEKVDEIDKAEYQFIKERVWVITTIPAVNEDQATEAVLAEKTIEAQRKIDENKVSLFNIRLKDSAFFNIKAGDLVIRLTKNNSGMLLYPLYKCIQASFVNESLYYISLTQQKGIDSKRWDEVEHSFGGFDLQKKSGEIVASKDKVIQEMLLAFSF